MKRYTADNLLRADRNAGCAFLILWGVYALASLAFTGFLVWAAIHFITKYW